MSRLDWIEGLTGEEPARGESIAQLRELLVRRLNKTFRDRPDFSSAQVEDIAQESIVKILNNLDTFEGRSQFTTWATSIAIRTAYSELRRKKWKDVSLDQVVEGTNPFEPPATQAASGLDSARTELLAAMYRAIDEDLTARQRDALLGELAGMPLEEIARKTGSNRNAIYKLTHDARKRLKSRLEADGYSSMDWYELKP